MISAKRFALSEKDLFKATQEFILAFAKVTDPVIYVSGKSKSTESKIAWTILGSALFQDISYSHLMQLLAALFKAFPEEKLWALPVPKEKDILKVADQVLEGYFWSLKDHLPGIFWSVGNFVRHHEDLSSWISQRTAEEIWRDLGEIYFMGKNKPRPKAAATIYRFISPSPLGLNIPLNASKWPPHPLSMGLRRYLSFLGPAKYDKFSELPPVKKQKIAEDLLNQLHPQSPHVAAHGLQFFLEKGTNDLICREHFKSCKHCPLFNYCKYASQASKPHAEKN